ncbi:MAG TPA: MlaD family protein, partial [Candidatus Caenarcaniphilales bacterium]|nr:MlaD family protein [Candidatus Caenarcaniphilales bacterium]
MKRGMSPLRAGIVLVTVITIACYFGFTKQNPFSNPYELNATFQSANNMQPGSPVRIAGVQVGEVK